MNKNLITALAITGLIIILGIFFIPWDTFFSETTVEYCGGDKSKPIRVFKNPSKAFSVFAQDYEFNFNTGVKVLDSASNNGNISIEAKKGIKEFREKLNQENIQFENLLKTAFYAYNQDGCNEEVKRKYWDILNTMSEKILKLEKLKNFNETIKEVENPRCVLYLSTRESTT